MEVVTAQLSSVLATYCARAPRTLQGPGAAAATAPRPRSPAPAAPPARATPAPLPAPLPAPAPAPLLCAADALGERGESRLEGEAISCFSVGGERRLCLPQILTHVLADFSLEQINRVCDELQIYCSRCTPAQLHELKAEGVLPLTAPSCGLITHSDAERLCAALLPPRPPAPPLHQLHQLAHQRTFRLYHLCFGRCAGVCAPQLHAQSTLAGGGACIQCEECLALLTPQRFVLHAHGERETRTCHWGFDSARWRRLVLVDEAEAQRDRCEALLDDMYARDLRLRAPAAPAPPPPPAHHHPAPHPQPLLKRKQMVEGAAAAVSCKREPLDVLEALDGLGALGSLGPLHALDALDTLDCPPKKLKVEEPYYVYIDPYMHLHAAMFDRYRALSAFRPWRGRGGGAGGAGVLSQEPPALQHPERVVRLADRDRFETSYQPNVALKPPTPASSDEITSSTSPPTAPAALAPAPAPSQPPAAAAAVDASGARGVRDLHLNEREAALDKREAALDKREAALDKREAALAEREMDLDKREVDVEKREAAVREGEAALEARRAAAESAGGAGGVETCGEPPPAPAPPPAQAPAPAPS